MSYRLELWKHGFLGTAEAHPLRQIQAMIRARAANTQERHTMIIHKDGKRLMQAGTTRIVHTDEYSVIVESLGLADNGDQVTYRVGLSLNEVALIMRAITGTTE